MTGVMRLQVFEKDKSRGSDGTDDDPFAVQHVSLCPESRLLCVAGASAHLILYKYCKTETLAEVTVSKNTNVAA